MAIAVAVMSIDLAPTTAPKSKGTALPLAWVHEPTTLMAMLPPLLLVLKDLVVVFQYPQVVVYVGWAPETRFTGLVLEAYDCGPFELALALSTWLYNSMKS